MINNFNKVQLGRLSRMPLSEYISSLRDDINKLVRDQSGFIDFFITPGYNLKDKKVNLLLIGDISGVSSIPKSLRTKKYLLGTCFVDTSQKKIFLFKREKGSDDALMKALKSTLKLIGMVPQIVAELDDNTAKTEEMASLQRQLEFYISEVREMLKDQFTTSDATIRELRASDQAQSPAGIQILASFDAKLIKLETVFVKHLDRLYSLTIDKISSKKIKELDADFAKKKMQALLLVKLVQKKLSGGNATVINTILFHAVARNNIENYDNEGHLQELAKGDLNDRHPKNNTINVPMHQHLDGGKKGMAFTYIRQADGSITPVVYDYAPNRNGNRYAWVNGGQSSGPPKVPSL